MMSHDKIMSMLGGPSSPSVNEVSVGGRLSPGHPGRSLLDDFIIAALIGLTSKSGVGKGVDVLAKEAVTVGLATLKERNKSIDNLVASAEAKHD